MLRFRKNSSALKEGKTLFYDLDDPILSFSRTSKDQKLVSVFNLSHKEASIQFEGLKNINNCPSLNAHTEGSTLILGANGFCFFFVDLDIDVVKLEYKHG